MIRVSPNLVILNRWEMIMSRRQTWLMEIGYHQRDAAKIALTTLPLTVTIPTNFMEYICE